MPIRRDNFEVRAAGFWIFDFGFWIEVWIVGFISSNPKSKIQNPKFSFGVSIVQFSALTTLLVGLPRSRAEFSLRRIDGAHVERSMKYCLVANVRSVRRVVPRLVGR